MNKQITIVGCGPGATDLMTQRGKKALEEADVVAGSERLINDFPTNSSQIILTLNENYKEILDQAESFLKENKKVVFLVSGDPLFYSYGESVIKRFGKDNCKVVPGISSVQYGFSRLGESWKEYNFFSLHGSYDLNLEKVFEENEKFTILLSPKNNLKLIKNKIKADVAAKFQFRLVSNLSLPDEQITEISFSDFDKTEEESLSILITDIAKKN